MTEKTAKELKLKVDAGVYPLEAVQAAAYTLTPRAYVRIARNGGQEISVVLKPKADGADLDVLSGDFHNELLHEALRLKVSQANQKIREYIVTKALVSAQVTGEPPAAAPAGAASEEACPECEAEAKAQAQAQSQAAPVDAELEKEIEKLLAQIEKSGPGGDDPLGVAVPWEKKYGSPLKGKGKKGSAAPSVAPAAAPSQAGGAAGSVDAGLEGEIEKLLAQGKPAKPSARRRKGKKGS